jgi:hypothetical protein
MWDPKSRHDEGRKWLEMSLERGRKKSNRGKEVGGKREGKSVRE